MGGDSPVPIYSSRRGQGGRGRDREREGELILHRLLEGFEQANCKGRTCWTIVSFIVMASYIYLSIRA